MPNVEALDARGLENVYLGRVVLYVEAAADADVFRRILGPDVADRIEVQTPPNADGWEVVVNRVDYERAENDKVFGLLDGEAAVPLTGCEALIACNDHVFSLPEREGLLFISGHELENLMMLHGGFCDIVANDIRLLDIPDARTPAQVRELLVQKAQRFFLSALVKYAVLSLKVQGQPVELPTLNRFKGHEDTVSVLRHMKAELEGQGMPWSTVRDEMLTIIKRLRERFTAETTSPATKSDHLIRLADGKGLLNGVRQVINPNARWDGHLAKNLTRPEYADRFRDLIMAATAA